MMNGFGWGSGFGWIFMILFWGIVIVGIVAMVRWVSEGRSGKTGPRERTAMEILKERYARGEIEREEFEKKSRDLDR
jgi:putative membrane protein